MAKKERGPIITLKFRAYTSKPGYQQVDDLLRGLRGLYNDYLAFRRSAYDDYGIKGISALSPESNVFLNNRRRPELLRHLQVNPLRRVDKAFNAFFKRVKAGEKPGYPRFKGVGRYNTLGADTFTPGWLTVDPDKPLATLTVKGLPPIQFHHKGRIPAGVAPLSFTLTRRGRRLTLALTLPMTRPAMPKTGQAVGIDRGVNKMIALSTGESIPGIGRPLPKGCPPAPPQFQIDLAPEQQRRRRLSRRMARQRDAAVAQGRAHWEFRGISKKTGKPKFRLIWHGGRPSSGYIKTRDQFARSWERETLAIQQLLHRVSSDLVKRFDLIAVEDLHLDAMTRSAAGTEENPGKGVSAKSGLNREILGQRLGELLRQLAYKAEWAGKQVVDVPAPYTSQTCNQCGLIDPGNRRGGQFLCRGCGWPDDADTNAAKNILRQAVKAVLDGLKLSDDDGGLPLPTSCPSAPQDGDQFALNLLYAYGQAGAPVNPPPNRARRRR